MTDLGEVVRIYGIPHWTERGYDQVKDELGWADFRQRLRAPAALKPGHAGCGLHPYIPD